MKNIEIVEQKLKEIGYTKFARPDRVVWARPSVTDWTEHHLLIFYLSDTCGEYVCDSVWDDGSDDPYTTSPINKEMLDYCSVILGVLNDEYVEKQKMKEVLNTEFGKMGL